MVTFILNNEQVSTGKPSGSSLLDFIRYDMGLTGTKTGCREGDCGACTILAGMLTGTTVTYRSAVSCLMPLGNAHGKHIVTIEGINTGHLSHVQNALVDNGAIQCGFCTPGIVMSLVAEGTTGRKTTRESAVAATGGNICRCTGYKSIQRAAEAIVVSLTDKEITDPVRWLVERKQLPEYFLTIPERLAAIAAIPEHKEHKEHTVSPEHPEHPEAHRMRLRIAGGTDLMVQKPDALAESEIVTLSERKDLKGAKVEGGRFVIGASVTISEAGESAELKQYIPEISSYIRLIASEPVRNMATIAGNIVNASPIGDISIMLLALNAEVTIEGAQKIRTLPLRNLFLGYKKLDLSPEEFIRDVSFEYQPEPALYSFEKVSRRTHLDIASVNSAIHLLVTGDTIAECHLSAGGVSPVPLYLAKTSGFLTGRSISSDIVLQANEIMQEEVSPISDARGSAGYKRLLLRQLLIAHFMKLFPERIKLNIGQL
ncbi:MAG: FAD binding domain-containing protein [Bacteroidales bacterium]|nr:FAD binding domain-containing protein [Bacteroidales bacterium]